LKIFHQEKNASFDRIKSCRFENSGLIAKWHCSLRPGPAHSFPRPAHALACSPRAPPAPLLPHGVGHRPTSARLHRSCVATGRGAPFSFPPHHARTRPPSSILLSTRLPRADPLVFLFVSVQKPPRAPFHRFLPPRTSLAARSPLPLTPLRPSARFPASDSTDPHRKLPRSRHHPISLVSSFARPPLAKMVVPHRALSLSLWSPATQLHHRWPQGGFIATEKPLCVAAPPPRRCRATSVRPITPLLARRMLCGPLLFVPATSSHLGHR
jgi:hypothetical protein